MFTIYYTALFSDLTKFAVSAMTKHSNSPFNKHMTTELIFHNHFVVNSKIVKKLIAPKLMPLFRGLNMSSTQLAFTKTNSKTD